MSSPLSISSSDPGVWRLFFCLIISFCSLEHISHSQAFLSSFERNSTFVYDDKHMSTETSSPVLPASTTLFCFRLVTFFLWKGMFFCNIECATMKLIRLQWRVIAIQATVLEYSTIKMVSTKVESEFSSSLESFFSLALRFFSSESNQKANLTTIHGCHAVLAQEKFYETLYENIQGGFLDL